MTESSPTSANGPKPTKAFSCVRCFERKVKCDKEHPCSGCVRSNVECVFRVPAPPRRKKKRTQEDILTERLNQYEQMLQQKGIDVQKTPVEDGPPRIAVTADHDTLSMTAKVDAKGNATSTTKDPRTFVTPKLIWEEGRSRFTENNLWTRVAEEFPTSQEVIHESSDEEDADDESHDQDDNVDFALGWTPSSMSTKNLHPPPEQISSLWQNFLDNVHPFTMLVHEPTMTATIHKAMMNLEHVPRSLEALMFAIYSIAVTSMVDRDVENACGEAKDTLLRRYRNATKSALARVKFMGTSDISVLVAFVLHLLAMREVYDGRTLWTLTGVALRIGEGMGLHRDGAALGLPPFKTELRRRLWFQITTLDYRSAELSGSSKFKLLGNPKVNTKAPLNVNDEDIWPDMTEPPVPHQKATAMILCCLRYEFNTFWTNKVLQKSGSALDYTVWENFKSPKSIDSQDANIDELEHILEEKYVRYCDPTEPKQLMASIVARTATNTMRFMAHHPRRWGSDDEIPEDERKMLWKLCIKILESYTMCITFKSLERFAWHTSFYFQWQALIYILDCLRAQPTTPAADEAWKIIEDIFGFHKHFISNTKKAIHVAVGSLCLKAYGAREQAFQKEGRFLSTQAPDFIQKLRQQRDAAAIKSAERKAKALSRSQSQSGPSTSVSNDLMNMMGFETTPSTTSLNVNHQQLPLPVFSAPTNNKQTQQQQQQQSPPLPHLPHTSTQPQQHRQQQNQPQPQTQNQYQQSQGMLQLNQLAVQQPAPFWFESFNAMSNFSNNDMDWMMMQDPGMNQDNNQMDWTQWDFLLQDEGGTIQS